MGALEIDPLASVALPLAADTAAPLALLEVLDRDGQVRQSLPVAAWPLRIGRAIDNDLVLADPHVAAQHLCLALGEPGDLGEGGGLAVHVGNTRNGVAWGVRHLRAGAQHAVPAQGEPVEFTVGRTRLRLRLPGHTLAPELPLAAVATRLQRALPIVLGVLVLLAAMGFSTYLANDPDGLGSAIGSMLLTAVFRGAVWCGAWALLSKTFTRQSHFGWHLRVFLFASIGLLLVDALPNLLAFVFSWPVASDYSFIGTYAVGAAALYFHLLAVEPSRPRLLRGMALCGVVAGVALTLWFNLQRTDRVGEELYMSHLYPPSWRLARPVPAEKFIQGLAPLKAVLDKKAKEPVHGDDVNIRGDDE